MPAAAHTVSRPTTTPRRVVAAAVGLSLVLAACSGDAPGETGEPGAEGGDTGTTIDVVEVTDDAVGDATPCVPPECGTTVPFEFQPGSVGPATGEAGATAAVDEASVVTAVRGPWWGQGLVTAGPEGSDGAPVVRAVLRDASGEELAALETEAMVAPVRPGEAVPFQLVSEVPTESVASVDWLVGAPSAAADPAGRELVVDVFWSRAAGEQRPLSVPGFSDAAGGPFPLVLYAGVQAPAGVAVEAPAVVAAWVDGAGRLLAVDRAPVLAPGEDGPLEVLDPGGAADAVVVVDDVEQGQLVNELSPRLWGVSR